MRQAGHQVLPAVRGRQCCLPSHGELAGHQQEPHAVHEWFLKPCRTVPPAKERTGSPGSVHCHAKPQALPQQTWQEADRTWPVQIPVPGRPVCHCLQGPQAPPFPEQLP